ncbi:uncharacterized protein [Leptinotarsa decemlineata]|uniref:uncharacterized protein n=1 Tax=Leptinotarsa decemlineata TaxID=7539 RepID=UPI003D306398
MGNKAMELRKEARDYGRNYEYKMAALLATRLALDSTVADFRMVCNIEGVGDFDDVVVEVVDKNGSVEVFCVQLKHKAEHTLSLDSFLKKYKKAYDKINENINTLAIFENVNVDQVHLILYTNTSLKTNKGSSISMRSIPGTEFLNTSKKQKTASEIINPPTPMLALYDNQADEPQLDALIRTELYQKFKNINNISVGSLVNFFSKWSLGRKSDIIVLNKKNVQERLLEFILMPYVVDPEIGTAKEEGSLETLRKTLVAFNVTNISEPTYLENVFAMIRQKINETCEIHIDKSLPWNTNIAQDQLDSIYKQTSNKDKDLISSVLKERQQFVPHLVLRDLYMSAWNIRLIPIILDCRSSSEIVIDVLNAFESALQSMSFILIGAQPLTFGNFDTFENLCSLKDDELFENNLEMLSVSLQGKSYISLKFLRDAKEVLSELKPETYLSIIRTPPVLGYKPDLGDFHIERHLVKPTFELALLNKENVFKRRNQSHKGDLFIIIEGEEEKIPWNQMTLRVYFSYINRMNLIKYLSNVEENTANDNIYILTIDQTPILLKLAMDSIKPLHDCTGKSVHILKLETNGRLEWLRSEGSVGILQDQSTSFNRDSTISEYALAQEHISKLKIISSNAGMGKTNLLKSMAYHLEENEWVTYVNLSDHISLIESCESKAHILQYLCNQQTKNCEDCLRPFAMSLMIHSLKDHMTWMFDGYDEVASTKTMSLLKSMSNMKLWVTTRLTFKDELEKELGCLAYELTCFSTSDHTNFLHQYFENHHILKYDKTQIDSIVQSIKKCTSFLDESFVGIPLQTKMFAEVFGNDPSENEDEVFTIAAVYNKFINIKLNEYTSYEATSLKRTLSKLALKLFYTRDSLENLIDFDDLDEDSVAFKESYKKDSIVSGISDNGEVLFGHRTFAEFLAAQWLSKKIMDKKIPGNFDQSWSPLVKMLFYHELQPVRLFFDRILSEGLSLHSAVLSNDMTKTTALLESNVGVTDRDILGRSALQVAVTHGTFYDLYKASSIQGINNITSHSHIEWKESGIHTRILRKDSQQISLEIIEKLLEYGLENTKDRFFGYDLFDSAMKSCSLEVVESLYKKFAKEELLFEKEFIFEVFVFIVVHRNFHQIFSKRNCQKFGETSHFDDFQIRDMFLKNKELLQAKYNDQYLSEIASGQGSKEILSILLSKKILTIDQGFPLHRACLNGQTDIVRMLHDMGADVNKKDVGGNNPIFSSGIQKRSDVTYQLLKKFNLLEMIKEKKSSLTPLHYACQGGHLSCVEALLEMGADESKLDGFDFSPLQYAVTYGHSKIIRALVTNREFPREQILQACSTASSSNYRDCVSVLLDYIDVNTIDNDGNTFLLLASKSGSLDVIKHLTAIDNCDLNVLNTQEKFQEVVRWAQANNHALLSVKLISLGPKPLNSAKGGVGALHFAVRQGHSECVEALLEAGADKHLKDGFEGLGYTPLVWASLYGKSRITQILLSRTYRKEHAQEVELALIWASMLGYHECVEHLLELEDIVRDSSGVSKAIITAEFGFDARDINLDGNIPMLLAGKNCQLKVIQLLCAKKYKNNSNLNDALHWAVKTGDVRCVKGLLELGADAHSRDNITGMGYIPIVWACLYGKLDIVKLFLENKDKDYLEFKDLHLALNWACVGGHNEIVKLLLEFGLDVNVIEPNLSGNSPLISACQQRGTVETIDLLISYNCDLTIKNDEGKTALDICLERQNFSFAKRILMATKKEEFYLVKGTINKENLEEIVQWAERENDPEFICKLAELMTEHMSN